MSEPPRRVVPLGFGMRVPTGRPPQTHSNIPRRGTRGRVEIALMRGFGLVHHQEPISLPLTAQRVVAFVALRERPTLRLHVASTLWIDLPERRALANLRSAL